MTRFVHQLQARATGHSLGMVGEQLNPKKAILLLPRHPTSWRKLFEIAVLMRESPDLRPIFVLANAEMVGHANECRLHGIDHIEVYSRIEQDVQNRSPILAPLMKQLSRWFSRHDRLANCFFVSLFRMTEMIRRLKIEYRVYGEICKSERPAAILVPGDRELSPVPGMLRAGRELGIPTIIVATGHPYTQGVAFFRKPYSRFRVSLADRPPLLNFYAARRYPKQVHETAYGPMLFSPGWIVCALASLNMLPENPWVQGGGHSSYVLLNDRRRINAFLELGAPEHKLVLLGDHLLDPLFNAWSERDVVRSNFFKAHGLPADSKLIMFSVPNDAEHNVCSWDEHLGRMALYFEKLGNARANVFLSLHPKSSPESYRALAEKRGLKFATQRLTEILPAADIFVCSGSSTIQWAQLCGVPAINLDYFSLKDVEYVDTPGVYNVVSPEEFEQLLQLTLAGNNTLDAAFRQHSADLRAGCRFDGQSGQRICSFLSVGINEIPLGGTAPRRSKMARL